jgi:hypothetical protein
MLPKAIFPVALAFAVGVMAAFVALRDGGTSSFAADVPAQGWPAEVATLNAEVERLKGVVPDQSHAMTDVAIQYSNLWFAGERENWLLAQFCFDETRSHLQWAIRIIPVRKNLKGQEVRLAEIFAPIEATNLKTLGQTIAAKDKNHFEAAYRNMMDSCYACHLAADKPYLRLRVPEQPALPILDFAAKDEQGK